MKTKDNYKIFNLIKIDAAGGIRYLLPIYSGNKKLNLLLDSGADVSIIIEESLSDCQYKKYRAKLPLSGVGNELIKTKTCGFDFRLTESSEDTDYSYHAMFRILPRENSDVLKGTTADGVLGSDFLNNCIVDFKDSKMVVFVKHKINVGPLEDILLKIIPLNL